MNKENINPLPPPTKEQIKSFRLKLEEKDAQIQVVQMVCEMLTKDKYSEVNQISHKAHRICDENVLDDIFRTLVIRTERNYGCKLK